MSPALTTEQIALLLAEKFRPEAKRDFGTAVSEQFRDRTILVTGAGGSIGSELTRRLLSLHPAKLIALDQDENAIFDLTPSPKIPLIPVLGNIRDRDLVRNAFREHRPEIVFHAAAYKHVPILETQCSQAVLNNVFGTRILATAAIESGCECFVFLSTDKAVHSSSVLGATKRATELLIRQLATSSGHTTRFASIRFGNVLGSRGSVLPIFLRQIAGGGPITVTHPEMTRYFLTSSEAVQLILQSAALASCGEVFVPELGDPVSIVDLVRELIELHGLAPGKDVRIDFTAPRPGEKLHEELSYDASGLSATGFPGIFREAVEAIPPDFTARLDELESAAHSFSPEVRPLLTALLR